MFVPPEQLAMTNDFFCLIIDLEKTGQLRSSECGEKQGYYLS